MCSPCATSGRATQAISPTRRADEPNLGHRSSDVTGSRSWRRPSRRHSTHGPSSSSSWRASRSKLRSPSSDERRHRHRRAPGCRPRRIDRASYERDRRHPGRCHRGAVRTRGSRRAGRAPPHPRASPAENIVWRLHDGLGEVAQLDVAVLGEVAEGFERFIGATVLARLDDALGLADHVARLKGLLQLLDDRVRLRVGASVRLSCRSRKRVLCPSARARL